MKFITGRIYENRKGKYKVINIQPNRMTVQYLDGTKQIIQNIELQKRIVEHVAEEKQAIHLRCLCDWPDEDVLNDVVNESLPDYSLVNSCCWRRICQVRGRNYHAVELETWVNICSRRGYLQQRQNPRGF
jgi:hypothetical protein